MILNILNLKYRTDRFDNCKKESLEQGFKIVRWNGIRIPQLPFKGVSMGHKSIVRFAKNEKLKQIIIAEDDIYFTAKGAWQYYLDNTPEDYDIYFGCVYNSEINENGRILFGLAGLTLYTVHERFYDVFLGLTEMDNLDRRIGTLCYKYKYMVCPEFVCHQRDGFSDHKQKDATYGHLIKGIKMFGVD